MGVQTRPAGQIQHLGRLLFEDNAVNPVHVSVDRLETTTGEIVLLVEVAGQHPFAELRLVPRNVVAFCPRRGGQRALNQVE